MGSCASKPTIIINNYYNHGESNDRNIIQATEVQTVELVKCTPDNDNKTGKELFEMGVKLMDQKTIKKPLNVTKWPLLKVIPWP
jgi:hypothetical protein